MSGRDDKLGISLIGWEYLNPTISIGERVTSGVDR